MRAAVVAALVCAAAGFRAPRKAASNSSSKSACGAKGGSLAPQIVNGEEADECEWKWQVGLASRQGRMPFCGGMLVAEDWVLTAAHCMGNSMVVVAGDLKPTQTSGKEQSRSVSQVFVHPSYNSGTTDYDYAMVQLSTPMDLNGCVGTVCLPEVDVPAGSTCWITGWGTLRAGGSQPDTLQEGAVNVLSNAQCRNTGYSASQITDAMLCAQGRTASGGIVDACQGDSGGPLVCEVNGVWEIHGATSWGRGCAGANYPGIWSRITYVREWIDSVMAGTYTTPKPVLCPSWSATTYPDRDGDCKCSCGKKCSTSGGAVWNCPSSGGLGGWGGTYFSPDCEDCQCYSSR